MGPRRAAPCLAALMLASGLAACSPDDPVAVETGGRLGGGEATTTTHAPFPTSTSGPAPSSTSEPPTTVTTTRARPAPTSTTSPATTTTATSCGPSRDFRSYVHDLVFTPDGRGLAAGAGIRNTADGGRTWAESCVAAGPNGWVRAIDVRGDRALAVGAGDRSEASVPPLMARSADGGLRWETIVTPVEAVSLDDVAFADGERAVAVGRRTIAPPAEPPPGWDGGPWANQNSAQNPRYGFGGVMLRTEDGGLNWRVIAGLPDGIGGLRRVGFSDGTHGWALGQASSGAPVLLGTDDAGVTWSPRPLPDGELELVDVVFVDGKTGWMAANEYTGQGSGVVLDGLILSTSDGGATWTRRFSLGRVEGARMWDLDLAGGHVFVVGQVGAEPVVLTSGDLGVTWARHKVPGSSHTTVEFVDPLHGWVAGMRGTCTFATLDGGLTWSGHSPNNSASCNG